VTASTAPLRVISYGGGVQSTALIVLAAQGRLDETMGGPAQDAIFANVGEDSEHPDTLRFVEEVMTPWAGERGITIHTVRKGLRGGGYGTIAGKMLKEGTLSYTVPAFNP